MVNVSATEDMKTMSQELGLAKDDVKKIQGKWCNFIKENNTILMYSL